MKKHTSFRLTKRTMDQILEISRIMGWGVYSKSRVVEYSIERCLAILIAESPKSDLDNQE